MFTAEPGPLNEAVEIESDNPADFLSLFLTDGLLGEIVTQSYLYADNMDQRISYYACVRRSNKWTNKLVVYLFQICIFNAFVQLETKQKCPFSTDFIQ